MDTGASLSLQLSWALSSLFLSSLQCVVQYHCLTVQFACLVPGTGGDFLLHCAVAFPSPGWFGLFSNWGLGSSSYIPDLPSSHCHSFLCPSLRTHNRISPSCRAEFLSTVTPPHLAFPRWASHSKLVLASFLPVNLWRVATGTFGLAFLLSFRLSWWLYTGLSPSYS